MGEPLKKCSECNETMPIEQFRKSSGGEWTVCWCDDCRKSYHRAYYQKNKQSILAVTKENHRKRRATDPQRERDLRSNWRFNNRAQSRLSVKKSNEKNRELYLIRHRANEAKRRAIVRNDESNFTADDIVRIFAEQRGECAYCREDISVGYHVDHITPLARGGGNEAINIALACPPCNCSKGARLLSEWGGRHS